MCLFYIEEEEKESPEMGDLGSDQPEELDRNMWAPEEDNKDDDKVSNNSHRRQLVMLWYYHLTFCPLDIHNALIVSIIFSPMLQANRNRVEARLWTTRQEWLLRKVHIIVSVWH